MAGTKKLKDFKTELQSMKHLTPWEKVKNGAVYHIAPLLSLPRMDVLIRSVDKEKAEYTQLGDKDKSEGVLHNTSILARFMVKRKAF
jgi:hypothetical protein